MAKRKYSNFIVECSNGEHLETEVWREAFAKYYKSESATIYGLPNYDGAAYEVVLSR